ncbi:alpha/beta fold hydrolase [Microbacterium sp. NPDC056234]|uniref:alpha/beta fold hydrolase n=1 Tax=Microbacterium sp. NPDC056234 TaxID=3345757 RepID=UPI0035D8128B
MASGFATEHGDRTGETIILLHGGNIANWMWAPQVERLAGRHLLTPDVVGFGARSAEHWPGVDGAAAFPALTAAMPQTRTRIAPKMRHVWSIQDADLFTRAIVDFVDRGVTPAG